MGCRTLPDPGIEPTTFVSPAPAGGLFTTSTTWEAMYMCMYTYVCVCMYICLCVYMCVHIDVDIYM